MPWFSILYRRVLTGAEPDEVSAYEQRQVDTAYCRRLDLNIVRSQCLLDQQLPLLTSRGALLRTHHKHVRCHILTQGKKQVVKIIWKLLKTRMTSVCNP